MPNQCLVGLQAGTLYRFLPDDKSSAQPHDTRHRGDLPSRVSPGLKCPMIYPDRTTTTPLLTVPLKFTPIV
jgi:hypothetical protein